MRIGRVRCPVLWCLTVLVAAGCSRDMSPGRDEDAKQALAPIISADQVTLYSIDIDTQLHPEITERFQDYPVLGKLDITAAATRRAIADAVADGIRRCRMESGFNCFWPRHGIRATRGGETTDFVICFQCAQIYVYDGKGAEVGYYLTNKAPQPVLNKLLTDAGIPLSTTMLEH